MFGNFDEDLSDEFGDEPDPSEAHLGSWRVVAIVADGKPVLLGPPIVMDVTHEGYTVKVGGKFYEQGMSRANRSVSPVQSEVMVQDGPRAGQILRQITRIEGDVMIACAGEERPTTFQSRPKSGHTLSIWLRI